MAIFNPLTVISKQAEAAVEPAKEVVVTSQRSVFNPLESISETQEFKSESRIQNVTIGECAKCKQPMSKSVLGDGAPMYFCEKCRVVSPMPDPDCVV